MPYPFIQCPTFTELKDKLCGEYGCKFKQGGNLQKEGGISLPVTYFEREIAGKTLTCVIHIENEETRIEVDLIRNICDRLQVPRAAFDLTLE